MVIPARKKSSSWEMKASGKGLHRLIRRVPRGLRPGGWVFAVFGSMAVVLSSFGGALGDDFGDPNFALASQGSVAAASSAASGYPASNANDGNMNTRWKCNSGSSCWLQVTFAFQRTLDEIDIHMPTEAIASAIDLYADLNGDGTYSPGERIHQVTGNGVENLIIPLGFTTGRGVRAEFISMVPGSDDPSIKELEVYLRDADQDGLFNGFEMQKRYVQNGTLPSVPLSIPDGDGNSTVGDVRMIPWNGTLLSAIANFTANHAIPSQLTVQIGQYNVTLDRWVDRYVWDPGDHAPLVEFKVLPTGAVCCTTKVQAVITNRLLATEARFYLDGQLRYTYGTALTGLTILFPRWEWNWDTLSETESEHLLEVVLLDRDGNAVLNTSAVRVDNTDPSTSIASPVNQQTVAGTVLVSATATDGYQMGKVEFLVDGVVRQSVSTPQGGYYNWYWDTRPYTDGPHALMSRAHDAAGNTAEATITVTVVNPPDVAIRVPAVNSVIRGTVTVSVHADDPSGIQKVDFYVDDVLRSTDTTPEANFYTWDWVTTTEGEGAHNLKAEATDNYGQTNNHQISVTVDNTVPVVSVIEPLNGATVGGTTEASGTVVVRATATDTNMNRVELLVDGSFETEEFVPVAGTEYNLKWDTYGDESDGSHTLTVRAWDAAGNEASVLRTVSVDNHYPPTVLITYPLADEILYCDRDFQPSCVVTVTVDASDDEGLDFVQVTLPPGIVSKKDAQDVPFAFDWQLSKVPDGRVRVSAKAVDDLSLSDNDNVFVCVNSCMPGGGGGGGMSGFEMAGSGGPSLTGLVGMDPLTGETPVSTDAKGVTSTSDLQDFGNYSWTIRNVDVVDDTPWTGVYAQGTTRIVAVDLIKDVRGLTPQEKASGILAPNFTAMDIAASSKWRIAVRDWTSGTMGNLTAFTLSFVQRTDPFDADSDGDGLEDGEEVVVADLDGNGWKELDEITDLRSIPVAMDTEADGLNDFRELNVYGTDPFVVDTDGDDLSDFDEVEQYYFAEGIPLNVTITNEGNLDVPFLLTDDGFYLYKFIMNVTVERYELQWGDVGVESFGWLGRQNDAMLEGRFAFRKDGLVAPSGSRGTLISETNAPPNFRMEEARFVVSLTPDSMDSAGSHMATLEVLPGEVSEDVTVHVTRFEVHRQATNATRRDTDGDGLKDGEEADWNAQPWLADTDEDGLLDGWVDLDGDGVWDPAELYGEVGDSANSGTGGWGTDPTLVDTDGDGLWDGVSFLSHLGELSLATVATDNDTDDDGLLDGWNDSDGDTVWDIGETFGEKGDLSGFGGYHTNPTMRDTDGDSVQDGWEVARGFNPLDYYDTTADADLDGWDARTEFLLDTYTNDADSDDDSLIDRLEVQDVLIRTIAWEGAYKSDYYGMPYVWVAYGGYQYAYQNSVTNATEDSPANTDSTTATTVLITILDDGARIVRNTTLNELYIWMPGADHNDTDLNGTGDGILQGTYHRQVWTTSTEDMTRPEVGFWRMEIYRGSNPFDNDTDEDRIEDGVEINWGTDTDSDGARNNADPDSDGDGIWDADEIDWALDSDGDGAKNMVDADSDSPTNGGTPDGLEPLWNADIDGDGLTNMADGDNDADHAPDSAEDTDHDGVLDAGESDINLVDTDGDGLWDGWQDRNANPTYEDWLELGEDTDADGIVDLGETDPALADTDADGLLDSAERQVGTFWREAEDHKGTGVLVFSDPNAVGGSATYLPTTPGVVYTETKTLSPTSYRYRILVRARQYSSGTNGNMQVQRLDSTTLESVVVDSPTYEWFSSASLEAKIASSVALLVKDLGISGGPSVYIDRIALVRVDHYHWGQACGSATTITFTFSNAAGGEGSFCYEVPSSAYPRTSSLQVTGQWVAGIKTVQPITTARAYHASATANGFAYIFAGQTSSTNKLNTGEKYDPTANTWTLVTPSPSVSLRTKASMSPIQGELIITGGDGTWKYVTRYNLVTGIWSDNTNKLLNNRAAHASVTLDGRVYVIGGHSELSSQPALTSVEEVDVRRSTWATTATAMGTARKYLAAVVLNGYIYAIGGASGGSTPAVLRTVVKWKPGDSWTSITDLQTPRWRHSAAVFDGKIWVFGGMSGTTSSTILSTVEVYDPVTNLWTYASPSSTLGRVGLAAAELDGVAYLTGGDQNFNYQVTSTVEKYNVSYPSDVSIDIGSDGLFDWTRPGKLDRQVTVSGLASPLASYVRGNVTADAGKLLLVGGNDGTANLATSRGVFPNLSWWESLPNAPIASTRGSAAVWDGVLYFLDATNNAFRALDLKTYVWTTKASPTSRPFDASLVAFDGKLYLMGGYVGTSTSSAFSRYTIATNTWTSMPPMPMPVEGHASALVDDDIYIVGGRRWQGSYIYESAVRIYDTPTATWSTGPSIWRARAGLEAIVQGGAIYAFGGYDGTYAPKLEVLYPGATSWANLSNMPTSKGWFAAGTVGGRIYSIGGKNPAVLSEIASYDIGTDSWSVAGNAPTPIVDAATAFAGNLAPVLVRIRSGVAGVIKIVPQGGEAWPVPSDPSRADSDGDGLVDGVELVSHGSHALLRDSDADRIPDTDEVTFGSRPDLADTDRDGLWDGYLDVDGDRKFDAPIEIGEDVDLDGFRDGDETDRAASDSDGDGLLDGQELLPGFGWFEAEAHLSSGAVAYDVDGNGQPDAADGALVQLTAPATGKYRYSVLVKGVGTQPATLTFSWTVGATPGQSTANLYYETDRVKTGYYRWYSAYFDATAGATITLKAPLDAVPNLNLRIDRFLFVRVDQIVIIQVQGCSPSGACIQFASNAGGIMKTITVTLPAITDGVPRYVASAKFKADPSPTPPLPATAPYMMRATIAGRSLCAKPGSTSTGYSIDYAGEFNKYLAKVGWDGLASIIVPISFSAYDDCYSPAVSLSTIAIPSGSVSVVLEPVASSPLSTDTDGEGVLDAKEREIRTNALMANSDNDQKTQGTELWDCTDLRETNAADTTCELTTPDPLLGTDPISADTDADGIADGIDANPFSADSDGDGVLDGAEAALGTDPNNADTDKDYFLDATDMVLVCTSQLAQSWISKGVKYDDIGGGSCRFIGEFTWGTKPLVADTDGDWLKDGEEVKPIPPVPSTNPLKSDTDGDKMSDGWEIKFNGRSGVTLNPNSATDGGLDPDSDGLTNADEYALGLDWCVARKIAASACDWDVVSDGTQDFVLNLADDDKDGIPTADELFYGSDAYVSDATTDLDGDGLTNSFEYTAIPPLDYGEPDTDGDGWEDGAEKAYWQAPSHLCPLAGGWAVCTTTYDVDLDGVADGDEIDGWYVWTLVDPEAGEWFEFHVASNPNDSDTDNDGVPDGTEYLRSDPTTDDTDGDGLMDWFPATLTAKPPAGKDDNVVEPENIPPTTSDILQSARIEWSWFIAVHTWLDLEVVATDNSGVAAVTFTFKDTGVTRDGLAKGGNRYGTTFEIDFWSDYMWGYEVQADAYDLAGNVMAKTAGGGLTYLLGKLVAGFLSFLLGPAIGGAVFGFFLGMLVGLFEDLSIFLHIHEIFGAISQLPSLIGKLFGNPSLLVALFVDMITAHMTRCMLVNPYGTPPGTTAQWADWVAARFFGSEPGGTNVVIFGVACTVGSIVGYMVQQFIVGTGIAKVLGKLKDAGKFASLTGKLSDGLTVVKDTVGKVATVAKGAAQKFTRGVGEAVNRFLKRIGLKLGDDAAQSVATCVARMGAANSCVLDRLVDVKLANGRRLGKDFLDGLHTRLGKMSPDAQAHVHRWAEELAQTASPKRASELEGYLRYVEKYGNDISEIRPHLNLGPDFRRITGGLEDVKHYPNVPDFLFPQLARRDAVQHLRHLQEFGPTKIVYPYRMPDTFTQLLEGFGVSPGDIVNGL